MQIRISSIATSNFHKYELETPPTMSAAFSPPQEHLPPYNHSDYQSRSKPAVTPVLHMKNRHAGAWTVDTHGNKLSVPMRRFLANLGLPVVEVAFIHPGLSAEGTGGHVALKEGLILRPECVYRFHTVLFYEPQSYSRGDMGKRRGLLNAYS